MANYNVHGFGGVKFEYGLLTAEFPYGFGQAEWKRIVTRIQNSNYKIFERFEGHRPVVSCKLISAVGEEYVQVQNLINIINSASAANSGITIYPKWTDGANANLTLTGMLFDSDFSIEDLARREGIQGLELDFIRDELVSTIPNSANAGSSFWAVQTDDTVIDGKGNSIIWR